MSAVTARPWWVHSYGFAKDDVPVYEVVRDGPGDLGADIVGLGVVGEDQRGFICAFRSFELAQSLANAMNDHEADNAS